MGGILVFLLFIGLFAVAFVFSILGNLIGAVFRLFGIGSSAQQKFNADGFYQDSQSQYSDSDSAEVGKSAQGQQRLKNLKNMAQDADLVE